MPKRRHAPRKPLPPRMTEEQVRQIVASTIDNITRKALEQGGAPAGFTISRADGPSGGIKPATATEIANGGHGEYCGLFETGKCDCKPKIDRAKPLSDAQTGAAPASTVSRTPAADTGAWVPAENSSGPPPSDSREATPGAEEIESKPSPADVAAVRAEMNRLFEPDGRVRGPLNGPTAPPGEKATSAALASESRKPPVPSMPAEDGWGDAAAMLFYQGACIFTGRVCSARA
jgi:hypothetical protein